MKTGIKVMVTIRAVVVRRDGTYVDLGVIKHGAGDIRRIG
jgi:hypothetical protein